MEQDKFRHFTTLHAMYLKQVFDIMPAPGKASLLCLVPQNKNHTPEVVEYAKDIVDYFVGAQSVAKYVYGDKENQWYLASRTQNAEQKLNRLVDLMIYNNKKNELLNRLNVSFQGSLIRTKSGDLRACFIPIKPKAHASQLKQKSSLNKIQQELALYFGWSKDSHNCFWSKDIGISARLMHDMQTFKNLKKTNLRQSLTR